MVTLWKGRWFFSDSCQNPSEWLLKICFVPCKKVRLGLEFRSMQIVWIQIEKYLVKTSSAHVSIYMCFVFWILGIRSWDTNLVECNLDQELKLFVSRHSARFSPEVRGEFKNRTAKLHSEIAWPSSFRAFINLRNLTFWLNSFFMWHQSSGPVMEAYCGRWCTYKTVTGMGSSIVGQSHNWCHSCCTTAAQALCFFPKDLNLFIFLSMRSCILVSLPSHPGTFFGLYEEIRNV